MNILELIRSQYKKTNKKKFSQTEKMILRPIAETIAILDGNGFFGLSRDENGNDTWYEQYLQEAYMIYKSNPSVVHGTSWYHDHFEHENTTIHDAYMNWQLLRLLSTKN